MDAKSYIDENVFNVGKVIIMCFDFIIRKSWERCKQCWKLFFLYLSRIIINNTDYISFVHSLYLYASVSVTAIFNKQISIHKNKNQSSFFTKLVDVSWTVIACTQCTSLMLQINSDRWLGIHFLYNLFITLKCLTIYC